jgi:hypothetical protein
MHSGSPEIEALERRYLHGVTGAMSHLEAIALFAALWAHARTLNPHFPGPWQDDIGADIELARVLNGLPSAP